jgi:hypothetical protein
MGGMLVRKRRELGCIKLGSIGDDGMQRSSMAEIQVVDRGE